VDESWFWAITLSTEIATDIRVNGSETDKRTIYVKATDHFQAATEGNWLVVNERCADKLYY
jgi:hypothetical protein